MTFELAKISTIIVFIALLLLLLDYPHHFAIFIMGLWIFGLSIIFEEGGGRK